MVVPLTSSHLQPIMLRCGKRLPGSERGGKGTGQYAGKAMSSRRRRPGKNAAGEEYEPVVAVVKVSVGERRTGRKKVGRGKAGLKKPNMVE